MTDAGREGTGRFQISGELKLTFIGAGAAFFETGVGLPGAMAVRTLGPLHRRGPTNGSYGFDCLWRPC